jgi:hypothetical protein
MYIERLPFCLHCAMLLKMEAFMSEQLHLDISKALQFLDMLDPTGRHTIASEAPFGGKDRGPKWEGGATYEHEQRDWMIDDIKKRQARGSNVYYSVNRPCHVTERQGANGKNNIDDIIAVRAMAFDIDFTTKRSEELDKALLNFINTKLIGDLKPSVLISTGGGFQLIYFIEEFMKIKLFRNQSLTDEQKRINENTLVIRSYYTQFGHDVETYLRKIVPKDLQIKIDNMSNIDRVMRLPGTVNYPKLEKIAKGQVPALAHISVDYHHKSDIRKLRNLIPQTQALPEKSRTKLPYIPRANDPWTAYEKAKACVEYIRDNGLADSNEDYTLHVMLPLIGAIHDEHKHNQLTIDEAEELFLEAVSGGERYGMDGRGEGYFKRQWRSHRPAQKRNGTKSIGGLVWFAQQNGMKLPWVNQVFWEPSFAAQQKELSEKRDTIPADVVSLLRKR